MDNILNTLEKILEERKSFTAEKSGNVYFCGCKQTSNQPFCDGSHANL